MIRLDPAQLGESVWDAAIIGAGPAGGFGAALLAERGGKVLLLDKSSWPRHKVCGGCLNAAAVQLLAECGLNETLEGSQPIHRVAWRVGGQILNMAAPGGAAILRREFDAALIEAAIERGAVFIPNCAATVLPTDRSESFRTLALQVGGEMHNIRSRAILACDGVNGTSLAEEHWAAWHVAPDAWIGVAATLPQFATASFHPGEIHMHIGDGGYAGVVRLPNGETHIAAALDPVACRKSGGPAALIRNILESCGISSGEVRCTGHFAGTGFLARRRRHFGAHRVFAVGDACGYVEPFTGEGMAWAMQSARAAVELLPAPEAEWPADLHERWRALHSETIGKSQRFCRLLRPVLHRPGMASTAVFIGRALPPLSDFIGRHIAQPRVSFAATGVSQGGAA